MTDTINLGELFDQAQQAGAGEPVPTGTYQVGIEKAEAVPTKTGKQMIKLVARVTEGPEAKRPLYTQLVISPGNETALSILFRHLSALGLKDRTVFAEAGGNLQHVADLLVGRPATFVVKTGRMWSGQVQADVEDIRPPDAGSGDGFAGVDWASGGAETGEEPF